MTGRPAHFTDPRTLLVALEGGPKHRQWFFYADWLAARAATRRGRYWIGHPCAAERRYLPTDRYATNPDPAITDRHGLARVWIYVELTRWWNWQREYFTPEEIATNAKAQFDHEWGAA
ncbi:hypothetical protein F4560_006813 [Saccharothrix ecbatanensis]|uniref:Uncharacterized protein n=1 Tax=Saccharothrix ecbatanensis TaxID=1105145 RepID=A0A7W9HRD6_9PSEU|nr:hypothetical protein [Saccharothrix ecbatanensis]MBB5807045.1 hypothetical protein [Saccharothrix ecbatanensis]